MDIIEKVYMKLAQRIFNVMNVEIKNEGKIYEKEV